MLTEPLNVHSVSNIGIVFVPIPASIVKTIEGIDIKQTSLFFITGSIFFVSAVEASIVDSITDQIITKINNLITLNNTLTSL